MTMTPVIWLAAITAGMAVGVVVTPAPRRLLCERLSTDSTGSGGTGTDRTSAARKPVTSGGRAAAVLIRARRRRRTVEPARVRQACEVLAAELRSGATPHAAWEVAGERLPGSTPVVAAAATGGDLHAALDGLVGSIGPDARPLAMAWVVADRFGAPVADLLERVAAGMRDEETIRREVAAQLAGPRATSRLLAGLPVLGLPIGFGLGVDPLGFLLGSPFGVACLVAGAALTGLGMWWIGRLVSRAERLR